jgi:hypothetical protein
VTDLDGDDALGWESIEARGDLSVARRQLDLAEQTLQKKEKPMSELQF